MTAVAERLKRNRYSSNLSASNGTVAGERRAGIIGRIVGGDVLFAAVRPYELRPGAELDGGAFRILEDIDVADVAAEALGHTVIRFPTVAPGAHLDVAGLAEGAGHDLRSGHDAMDGDAAGVNGALRELRPDPGDLQPPCRIHAE
ncbi:MAG: hypothetical protein R2729_16190 [Bryobacteraceae bacterium]